MHGRPYLVPKGRGGVVIEINHERSTDQLEVEPRHLVLEGAEWNTKVLGGFLSVFGVLVAWLFSPDQPLLHLLVVPLTLVLVVLAGTLCGASLPLVFKRLGLDPALMSNPFVSGIIDILGILIYMNVALQLIAARGYDRGRDLLTDFERLVGTQR